MNRVDSIFGPGRDIVGGHALLEFESTSFKRRLRRIGVAYRAPKIGQNDYVSGKAHSLPRTTATLTIVCVRGSSCVLQRMIEVCCMQCCA